MSGAVVVKQRSGPTAERLIEETLALIAERGGSQDVKLREVSRRVGCAHTNVYNYFASFDDLVWEAFRRTLRLYAEHIVRDLDDSLRPADYFRRLVTNLASFPQENPSLYRFIGSDPIDVERIPGDILDTVSTVKKWLFDVFQVLCGPTVNPTDAAEFCNITYGYIDGEMFNYINGRVVPGEDIPGRIVANSVRLLRLLVGDAVEEAQTPGSYPALTLEN